MALQDEMVDQKLYFLLLSVIAVLAKCHVFSIKVPEFAWTDTDQHQAEQYCL